MSPFPFPPTPEEIEEFLKFDPLFKEMKELRWTQPDDYRGRTYEQYYRGPTRTRDSDPLTESNFNTSLEMLGGENRDGADERSEYYGDVIVEHWTHWGPGWVEQILVHYKAKDKIQILKDIKDRMENYPVLDEEDFSQREWDQYEEDYDNWARDAAITHISRKYYDKDSETFEEILDKSKVYEKDFKEAVLQNLTRTSGDGLDEEDLVEQWATDQDTAPIHKKVLKAMKKNMYKAVPNTSGKKLSKGDFVVYDGEIYTIHAVEGRSLLLDFYNGTEEMEDLPIKANLGSKR